MKGHGRRGRQKIGFSVDNGLEDTPRWRIGPQIVGVPSLHFKEVRNHPHADFMLSGLKHPQVDVFDRRALFNGIEDQATGNTSFTAHKSFEVDFGQRTQGRVLTEKAYAAVGISGRLPTAASRYSATV